LCNIKPSSFKNVSTDVGVGILATRVQASIVYQATPRDPVVLTGVIGAATWIPAQHALSVDPLILLREE